MFSHIVWTTYLTFPPQDKRGSWQSMSDMYVELNKNSEIEFSKPLSLNYRNVIPEGQKTLSLEDQKVVLDGIIGLAKKDGDRVAGGLNLQALGVTDTEVHLFIQGPLSESKQKIARLKSRSATLLGFSHQQFNGSSKNTWAKGLWGAEFCNEDIAENIREFVNAKNV